MLKKSLLIVLVLLLSKLTSFAQAPSFDYHWLIGDSCFNATNTNAVSGSTYITNANANTSVKFYWGDGTSDVITNSQGYFYSNHNYTTPGTYTIKTVLYDGTNAIDSNTKVYDAFCTILKGSAYKRNDNNCTLDAGENYLNAPMSIEVRKNGTPVDTIEFNGHFFKKIESADLTSVFSLHVLSTPNGTTLACPTTNYTFKFDTLDYTSFDGFFYAFDCDASFTDFDLSVTGSGFFRPVANSYIYLYPRNTACNATNSVLMLNLSPKYSFNSANVTPSSVNGNTITWDLSNLSNTSFENIFVTLDAVGTLSLGDTVINYLSISPTAGDINTANNNLTMIDSIRSSWDPNEKHASPIGNITSGELMTYTIHFENLGNDTAFNIHIIDTLSTYLDAASFKLITSSHTVSHQLIENGSIKTLRFDFANIRLADASAPDENKGFVTYQINAKNNLAEGTTIENTAHIYFDINPAIVTNTTKNKIPENVSIKKTKGALALNVYPNPGMDKLYITGIETLKDIKLVNTLGQEVNCKIVANQYLDIEHLSTGVYYIKAIGKDGLYMQKFVKK